MPVSVPVRIDVAEAARPAYAYALRVLLRGLGLDPVDAGGAPCLVVGTGGKRRSGRDAEAALVLPTADAALARLLDTRTPHAADAGGWMDADGVRVPVPLAASDGAPDGVGSAFLWLVRYAEHARGAPRDRHGRATFAASWQAAHGLATVPVVDVLRAHLDALLAAHPATAGLPRRRPTYGASAQGGAAAWALCPTCDVDSLRKWRAGIVRRDVLQAVRERHPGLAAAAVAGVLRSRIAGRDPHLDGIDRIAGAAERAGGRATFFLKTEAPTDFDTPYRLRGRRARGVFARIAGHELGLHPSYASPERPDALLVERARLERAAGREVRAVRQHYLRLAGDTSRRHAEAGLAVDSTLGWAEQEGFRCATTHPHPLFDLDANRELDVWEAPLALMDATLTGYRHLDPATAAASTRTLLEAARRHGGLVVGLWHTTVGDDPAMAAHLDATIDAAAGQGAAVVGVEAAVAAYRALV